MFIRSHDPVMLVRARAQLEQIPGIRVMSSAADNLEVITPAADKGVALGMLCRELGTDLDHAAAIGDSENDLDHAADGGTGRRYGKQRAVHPRSSGRLSPAAIMENGVAQAIYRHVLGE